MAAFPLSSVEKDVYQGLFEEVANGSETIDAGSAVGFLRKSTLDDVVLHNVWAMSDPLGNGVLDQEGFFTAVKLVALAQAGLEVSVDNCTSATELPQFGDLSAAILARVQAAAAPTEPPADSEFAKILAAVKPTDRERFSGIFSSLEEVEPGKISGPTARQVLVNSKLPAPILGRIWEQADFDKDGMLTANEFVVAMSLVYKELAAATPDSAAAAPSSDTAAPVAAKTPDVPATPGAGGNWVVQASDKTVYDQFFSQADKDGDGLVTGPEVMGIFMGSKLPREELAHVWQLCDHNSSGKLNAEQFALAMHIIAARVKGVPVPKKLTSEMIPPSLRGANPPPASAPADSAPTPAVPPVAVAKDTAKPATTAPVDPPTPSKSVVPAKAKTSTASAEALTIEAEELEAAKQQAVETAKPVTAALAVATQDVAQANTSLAQLRAEVSEVQASARKAESDLAQANADLGAAKAEEVSLRKQLAEGKAQLKKILEALKVAKGATAKVQATNGRLGQSNAKVDQALSQYGSAPDFAKKATAQQNKAPDPFSQAAAPADPFAPSANGAAPFAAFPGGASAWG